MARHPHRLLIALVLFLGVAAMPATSVALGVNAELANAAEIKEAIAKYRGKVVKLKLNSGQEIEGEVERIGSAVVALSKLSDNPTADALVRLDHVSAVVVKVREE